jgi:GT2 family glycosyltransferase
MYNVNYSSPEIGEPIERTDYWLEFFEEAAERIQLDIKPETILDANCDAGLLVEMLRKRGVEAWGIDSSEAAIQRVPEGIQPYCWVGSIREPFDLPNYDLIVFSNLFRKMDAEHAEHVIENLCHHTTDILFSPFSISNQPDTDDGYRPLEFWVGLFYRHGFLREVDYDASYMTPWTMRFRKSQKPVINQVIDYERKLWLVHQENEARRELGVQQKKELSELGSHYLYYIANKLAELEDTRNKFEAAQHEIDDIRNSNSWRLIRRLQGFRERIIPVGSNRETFFYQTLRGLRILRDEGLLVFFKRLWGRGTVQVKIATQGIRFRLTRPQGSRMIEVDELRPRSYIQPHQASVDIIVCVHNALSDVERCLESVIKNSDPPFTLILVDDGSDDPTRDFLARFSQQNNCELLRNEAAQGYTLAANQGLRRSSAQFVILLNSDTIVSNSWLDRMIACAQSDPKIGIVGPLSNTASWQSIPEIISSGDWADNPLPPNVSVSDMANWVASNSWRMYPEMTFLNGFCLLIGRQVIDEIGYFDEENFGVGYGEENDYCLRARKAGWNLALADDTYIFHAQSRSYDHVRRKKLSERANTVLAEKHGPVIIEEGTKYLRENRVMEGIRAHSKYLLEREQIIKEGMNLFASKRVLFIVPVWVAGGGSNLIILAARAMRRMGVDAQILNLRLHRSSFERAYPDLDVPITFCEIEEIPDVAVQYDSVIATFNPTVAWIAPAAAKKPDLVIGYYIQDYEPYFYEPDTEGYFRARESYELIPNMVHCCTTQWIFDEIQKNHQISTEIIGASMDTNLFWPRPRKDPEWPDRPVRIAAMIRPNSERRSPKLTMDILKEISDIYGPRVEFKLFGTKASDPGFAPILKKFPWDLAGEISQGQMANLLNETDIFVDFSTYQGLGLTAMEAMACGLAVIVPKEGGTNTFAQHEENSLVIDTSEPQECLLALRRLIDDHDLRTKLQQNSVHTIKKFHPERPTFNLLKALFLEGI